jgi:hypothetical protein
MYMSEMLVHSQREERLKQAQESRLTRQVAELRHLHRVQQRAERRLRQATRRAEQLRSSIEAIS